MAISMLRQKIYKRVRKVMKWQGCVVISQPDIWCSLPYIFHSGSVYLSQEGWDIYLVNMASGLWTTIEGFTVEMRGPS